jgi:cytoskeleton protein RodZ
LPSFGEKLKREREKRAITLEQISVSTKIGTRMLEALEQEKFDRLPGGIFNKGFVRAYARCLGLDEDQAVADYMEASGDAPVPRPEPGRPEAGRPEQGRLDPEAHGRSAEPAETRLPNQLPWGLLAALLLAIAVGLSIWSYRNRDRIVPPPPVAVATQKSAPPASAVPSSTSPPAGNARPVAAIQKSAPPTSAVPSSSSLPSGGSPKPVATASPAPAPDATTPSTKKTPATSPVPPPEAAATTTQLPGEFVVLIQAREDSWLTITADGEVLPSQILSAGSQRVVRGREQVIVRAGNAGGVDFFFNRKKLPSQGEAGEVKTLTFGPEGLQSNVLSPPTTP